MTALLLAAALAGAAAGGEAAPPSPVLVVGLDGLDWDVLRPLAAAGRLPNLSRMIAEGASGVMRVPEPLLSPAVWTTVATGRPPEEHGILSFTSGGRPLGSLDRKVPAVWNAAGRAGRTVAVVGWLATWPAESVNGTMVSHRALSAGAPRRVSPPGALAGLETWAAWDWRGAEGARRLTRFTPFPWRPELDELSEDPDRERHVLVGKRLAWAHMRDESFTRMLELLLRGRPDLAMVHLWGADHASHAFWRHAYGRATDEERREFGGVIPAYYEYLDEAVGRLRRAAGPAAVVVALSDHGFGPWTPDPGSTEPRLSGNHRPEAVLILSGPGVRRGASLDGAVPEDVAPTLLRLLRAAPPEGLKGRVLEEAFEPGVLPRPLQPEPMPPPPAGPAPDPTAAWEEEAGRLRALGYLR